MATDAVAAGRIATSPHAAQATKPKRDRRLHLSTARLWVIAAIITAFVFMFSFTRAWGERMQRLDNLASSGVFTSKTYATLDGGQFSTDSLKDTRLTAFNVWATNCPPCIRELPDLEKLNNSYDDSEFRVVGILSDSTAADGVVIQKHLNDGSGLVASAGVTFPVIVMDKELYAFIASNIIGTPTTFFVNSEGTIVDTVTGGNEYDAWETKVDEVLANL